MKSLVFISAVLCTLIFGSMSPNKTATATNTKQRAVTEFDRPITLQGVVLKGKYLFVHDDAAMSRGDACTYVYKGEVERPNKLVASFHCIPVERAKARHFMIRAVETSPGTVELREFQFNGDTEGHAVPTSGNTAVVPLAN